MKKFKLAVLALIVLVGTGFAQEKAKGSWAEAKTFHTYMSTTFHPVEEGDFKPLKEKADSLLEAARAWMASPIPDNYKPEETKTQLKKLTSQCQDLAKSVKAGVPDEKLKTMITEAHDTFHKIMGECKKPAAEAAHDH